MPTSMLPVIAMGLGIANNLSVRHCFTMPRLSIEVVSDIGTLEATISPLSLPALQHDLDSASTKTQTRVGNVYKTHIYSTLNPRDAGLSCGRIYFCVRSGT